MVLEDHETDALHGLTDVPGELRPALRAAVEEEAHVAGPDPRFLVEFLLRRAFGQVVGLFLFHLVVLRVFLVHRFDAVFLFGLIGAHDRTPGPAGRCSAPPRALLLSIASTDSVYTANISYCRVIWQG